MTLYLVATPIGNRQDITLRALSVLRSVDIIACEHPQHSAPLLRAHGIEVGAGDKTVKTPVLQWLHEHNERGETEKIIQALQAGRDVAVISDAGTPLIADPGFLLVRAAQAAGIRVVPIGGVSALLVALSGSGLPTHRFSFFGFPPAKENLRGQFWQETAFAPLGTVAIFLPPHKAENYLTELAMLFPTRPACLARELTKLYEEYTTLPLAELLPALTAKHQGRWRGEMVLLLAPMEDDDKSGGVVDQLVAELLQTYHQLDWPLKKAVAKINAITQWGKGKIYDKGLLLWKEEKGKRVKVGNGRNSNREKKDDK
ncbi:MAG: 16S rRNA (cytidine(1402)-2'-O)-methyltransferase [Alphaproteobacteria bacterium]|nr:16S rRNA (cytidine(1402)-2'-O)-methyltransferase [Alphaproteobacteria bacterium]